MFFFHYKTRGKVPSWCLASSRHLNQTFSTDPLAPRKGAGAVRLKTFFLTKRFIRRKS